MHRLLVAKGSHISHRDFMALSRSPGGGWGFADEEGNRLQVINKRPAQYDIILLYNTRQVFTLTCHL